MAHPPTQQPPTKVDLCFLQSSIFSLSRQLITFHGRSLLFQFTEQTCSKYSVAFQKISKPRGEVLWRVTNFVNFVDWIWTLKRRFTRCDSNKDFDHPPFCLFLVLRHLPLYCSVPPSFPISWFFFLLRQITLNITTMEGRFLLANKHEWIKAHFFFFCCFSELWPFCHFP